MMPDSGYGMIMMKLLVNYLDFAGRLAADVLDGANFNEGAQHVAGVPLLLGH